MDLHRLGDLCRPGLRYVNRQAGSGTRVWLDAALHIEGVDPGQIDGYETEKTTHSAIAQAVAEGQAQAGLGLEAAALNYGLGFLPLTRERYDLIIPQQVMNLASVQRFIEWLGESRTKEAIQNLGGYEVEETGTVRWVE